MQERPRGVNHDPDKHRGDECVDEDQRQQLPLLVDPQAPQQEHAHGLIARNRSTTSTWRPVTAMVASTLLTASISRGGASGSWTA